MEKSVGLALALGFVIANVLLGGCGGDTAGATDGEDSLHNPITGSEGDDAEAQESGDAAAEGADADDSGTASEVPSRPDASSETVDSDAGTDRDAAPNESDAGSAEEAPAGANGKVPAFIAVGSCVRRIVSCDGGRSWINDAREPCSEGEWYNDHAPHAASAAHTVDSGAGAFVASWGWGYNGPVLRTEDGVSWEETSISNADWFGGVAYGNDRFIVGRESRKARVSTDGGQTWQNAAPQSDFQSSAIRVRATGFVDARGIPGASQGRFIMMDDTDLWTTATGEGDFEHVQSNGCLPRNFASGNGVVLGAQESYLCRSSDGLKSFERVNGAPGGIYDSLIFHDGAFHYWTNGNRYSSTDGLSWEATPLTGGFRGGTPAIAYSEATQTFVAVVSDWQRHQQQAYYSSDGVAWTQVAFPNGPGVRSLAFGYLEPSEQCPAP